MKGKRLILTAFLVFCVAFLCFGALIYLRHYNKYLQERERVQYITDSQVSRLQSTLTRYFNNTRILEMLVIEEKGEIRDFEKIASVLFNADPALRSIQLAPNGVVTQVYPLKGNEGAFVDLFKDPNRKVEAEYARDTGEMTLSGPFELYQGGMGLVARRPVYLESEEGTPKFWGFTIVTVNVPEIFETAKLDKMQQVGYQYKLWRTDPKSDSIQIISESSADALKSPIQISFEVPNGTWNFCVMPSKGWVDKYELVWNIVIALVGAALIAWIAWLLLYLTKQKNLLSELSYQDSLTKLYNSRSLLRMLQQCQAENRTFGLIYLDLDRFKQINDTYGHDVGDNVLVTAAEKIQKCIGALNTAFRVGGDEFIVLLPNSHEPEYYEKIISKITQSFHTGISLDNYTILIDASFGFAQYPNDASDVEELVRKADENMYECKKSKRMNLQGE